MDATTAAGARVVVRRGRHVGWWVDAWRRGGHRVSLTWLPTAGLARWFAGWLGRRLDVEPQDAAP